MAVFLVRQRKEEAKIDIPEDLRAFKYASFNNGVLKDYLQECDYEVQGNIFRIKSGEIFIDAEQLDIDGNGKEIEVVDISGVNYYSIYAEIDLTDYNNPFGDIKATYSSIAYPTIDKGDNLTLVANGVARLELYRFEANAGRITNVNKMFVMTERISENSKKVNNLEIKMNNKGLLTIGDIIIPQKKVIWEGKQIIGYHQGEVQIVLGNQLQYYDKIRISGKIGYSGYLSTLRYKGFEAYIITEPEPYDVPLANPIRYALLNNIMFDEKNIRNNISDLTILGLNYLKYYFIYHNNNMLLNIERIGQLQMYSYDFEATEGFRNKQDENRLFDAYITKIEKIIE